MNFQGNHFQGNHFENHTRHGIEMPCHTSGSFNGHRYDGREKCDSKYMAAMLPWVDLLADLNGVDLPALTATGPR